MNEPRSRRDAMLAMTAVVLIWGVNVSVMKLAVGEVSPLVFNALRFPLGALLLGFLLFRFESRPWPAAGEWREMIFLGILAHPIYQLCFLTGLALTTASHTAVLVSTTPVFAAVADHFVLRERLGRREWFGIALSLGGVLLLTVSRGSGTDGGSVVGDLLVLLSGMLWTTYTIRSRPLLKKRTPIWVTAWALLIGTPFVMVAGIPGVMALDWSAPTAITWGGAVYAGLFALATAYLFWAVGIQTLGASRASIFSNLIPVVALAVAAVWLREKLPPLAWVGAGVALVGVWVTTATHSSR